MAKGFLQAESASRGEEAEVHVHHVLSPMFYLAIFGILMVGTFFTVVVAQYDLEWIFPGANTLVALAIALTKTAFVVLYFMHVRYSGRLVWLSVVGGIFWLLIMFAFTMQDYLTRGAGTFR